MDDKARFSRVEEQLLDKAAEKAMEDATAANGTFNAEAYWKSYNN